MKRIDFYFQSMRNILPVVSRTPPRLISTIFLFLILTGCGQKSVPYRLLRYGDSDINDFKKFPSRILAPAQIPFNFVLDSISGTRKFLKLKNEIGLEKTLEEKNTAAFVVGHHDTIVFERYYNDWDISSAVQYFSMTKSVMSLLIGCAIDDALIGSEYDTVTKYIPELKSRGFENITLLDLLQMQAPINYTENDNPFGLHAKFYYTARLEEETLKLTANPKGPREFVYRSCNIALLGLILKRVLKAETISQYLQRRIWAPVGMESPAYWTIDKDSDGIEKTWCCLAGTARDFAKIAALYLNHGKWNEQQIISENWIDRTLAPLSNKNEDVIYNYGWWIYPKQNVLAAIGKDGQFAYIVPAKDMVIIRLGKNMGGMKREGWLQLFGKIADIF